MQDMLNLAHHRKQSFKTGGGRAVTPPPTPDGSDLDDEDLERLPVVAADIEGADFSLPPDEVFQGSSSPVVSYRKNPHEPNQLTFIIENGRKSAGVDEGVNDEMNGSLMDEEEGGLRKKKDRENGRKSAGVDEVRVDDGMDGSLWMRKKAD